jgi:TPR repeat protein/Zn-dependent protease with chaperone function
MGFAVVAAAIFYFFYPNWIIRTRRLEPLSSSELPDLQDELKDILKTARVLEPPAFLWNPLATGLPLAFGRHGRNCVALSGAFIAKYFYKDKNAFRAILLHELAHIRNGDIYKTYLTLSLLLAFVTTALGPSLIVFVWYLMKFRWFDAGLLLFISIFWTSVIVLSGLAVLRAREYYADVQASAWEETSQIDHVLAALPAPGGRAWRRFLRFHPSSKERRQTVEDPSRLFRLGFADAFGIGVAAWSVVDVVSTILLPFLPLQRLGAWLVIFGLIKSVLSAPVFIFAVGAIGIGIWRSAFASLLNGDHPSKGTGLLAVAFVAGPFLGIVVLLAEAFLEPVKERPPFSFILSGFQIDVMTYVVLLVVCLLVFRWISGAASAWLEVVLQSKSPRPLLIFSVVTALILVVGPLALASYGAMFSFWVTPWREFGPGWIYGYSVFAGAPVLIASLAVWAFPLAAPWWRRRFKPTGLAHWVFLDGSSPELPHQEPLQSGRALLTGLVVGLVFWLMWELLYFRNYFPGWFGEGMIHPAFRSLFKWTARFFGDESFLFPGSAVGFQALAAAIAAARASRLSVVHGLFAASVAGCVIIAGDFMFFGIDFQPVSNLAQVALSLIGLGTAVALSAAITAAWIGNVARRGFATTAVLERSSHPVTITSTSSSMISYTSANPNAAGHNSRKGQKRSLFSKTCTAALCVAVGIGMMVRIRQEVLAMQEVRTVRASAAGGDSDAQNKLGMMYASGKSVAQDDAQAVFWWSKASERGYAEAQYNLAQMFLLGRGVTHDDVAAFQWAGRAAEQGHAAAENILGTMYASGRGVSKDDYLALRWFRQAAEQGFVAAQNNLGIFYALGRGTLRDDATAVESFRKAASRGYADAQNNLALMYQQGRTLPKDDALALQWFRSAAEQGHADAQFHVGEMYEKGEVVTKDEEQAVTWLRNAAEQGHSEAGNRLQALCAGGLGAACSR